MTTSRKVTPKVRDGRVQKKNRHDVSPSIWNAPAADAFVGTERPGAGYRHVLRKRDVTSFLDLLPMRDRVLAGLNGILLARGEPSVDGWYRGCVIGLCAWPRGLSVEWSEDYFDEHRPVLERLGVPHVADGGDVRCEFTEKTARDYLLLHVLLHELGHHHDRLTTRSQRASARGESYAESYALAEEERIWERYWKTFDVG